MNDDIKIFEEERPWGKFRKFTENTSSTVKIIEVKSNEELSLQSHTKRSEFWHVINGSGYFFVDGQEIAASKGTEQIISIGTKHKMKAGPLGMEVLEIGLGEFDEEDIVRYEDKYGRV